MCNCGHFFKYRTVGELLSCVNCGHFMKYRMVGELLSCVIVVTLLHTSKSDITCNHQ